MYKIMRYYKNGNSTKLVKIVSSLEEAQEHCKDPKTCEEGTWFDGYMEI